MTVVADLENTTEIYVKLLADEEGTLRPTKAIPLGNQLYKILPIPNFENSDEVWEFLPNSIVHAEKRAYRNKEFLLAVKQVK